MAIQWGDTGRVAYGTLKTFTFTYPFYENLNASPVLINNTSYVSGSFIDTRTIGSGDLPVITPSPISLKYTTLMYLGGKNTTASAVTLYFQINKNGTSVSTGNFSVSANQYWTINVYNIMNVVLNDKLDVYLWTTAGSGLLNYDYFGFAIQPTQINLSNAKIIKDLSMTIGSPIVPTKGNPSVERNGWWTFFPVSNDTNPLNYTSSFSTGAFTNNSSYAMGRAGLGDQSQGTPLVSNANNRPVYSKTYLPTQITFREVLR